MSRKLIGIQTKEFFEKLHEHYRLSPANPTRVFLIKELKPGTRSKQRVGRVLPRHRGRYAGPLIRVLDGERPLRKVIYMLANGPIPDGYSVHHIDGNKKNYHPDNLGLHLIIRSEPRPVRGLPTCIYYFKPQHTYRAMLRVDNKCYSKVSRDVGVLIEFLQEVCLKYRNKPYKIDREWSSEDQQQVNELYGV